jgi:hypothetical protein
VKRRQRAEYGGMAEAFRNASGIEGIYPFGYDGNGRLICHDQVLVKEESV